MAQFYVRLFFALIAFRGLGLASASADTPETTVERAAAEPGNVQAQNFLGWFYREGLGVEQDDAEAVDWIRKCAEQGEAWCQNNLGLMFAEGRGVEQDYTEAVKWYRRAAEQNHPLAQGNLGVMYLTGHGVPADESQGVAWLHKAAEQGDANAQTKLLQFGEAKRLLQLRSAWVTVLICMVIGLGSLIVLKLSRPEETVSQPEAG